MIYSAYRTVKTTSKKKKKKVRGQITQRQVAVRKGTKSIQWGTLN